MDGRDEYDKRVRVSFMCEYEYSWRPLLQRRDVCKSTLKHLFPFLSQNCDSSFQSVHSKI